MYSWFSRINTKNLEELLDIIDFGLYSRIIGIIGANLDSSRSVWLFTIYY